MRVPAFVHSPLLPAAVRGTIDHRLYHITDWILTLTSAAGVPVPPGGLALDGHNIWQTLLDPSLPSPRTEILHNLNQACGRGKMAGTATPSSALRLGDYKLLVGCFNITTMQPETQPLKQCPALQLYNIADDPFETTNLVDSHPRQLKQLMDRLVEFASSGDQYPPTLKPPLSDAPGGNVTQPGSSSWAFQCPQCGVGADGGASVVKGVGRAWVPWCEDVVCVPQNCSSLLLGNACKLDDVWTAPTSMKTV